MTAFKHVHGAEAEAKNIKLTCLAWALTIAVAIDILFVMGTLGHQRVCLHARTFMVNHAIGAHWSAHVTLCDNEAWWALGEPLLFAFLAALALFLLAVSTP